MKKLDRLFYNSTSLILIILIAFLVQNCNQAPKVEEKEIIVEQLKPEYFLLRPETEKAYGYSHAVKIGNDIKISGAVSMDEAGNPTAVGDFEQQMKNCYSDLEKNINALWLYF